jgi:hypothetical protein
MASDTKYLGPIDETTDGLPREKQNSYSAGTLSDALLQAIVNLKAKAKALGDARMEFAASQTNKPLVKDAAIQRIMKLPNPTAKPTKAQVDAGELPLHSYSSAELIVEQDPEYVMAVAMVAEAQAEVDHAQGEYDAAKIVATALANAPADDSAAVIRFHERRMASLVLENEHCREQVKLSEITTKRCREDHVTRQHAANMATTKVVAVLSAIEGKMRALSTTTSSADSPMVGLIVQERLNAERDLRK